jgi:hypothetical protein
MGHYIVGTDQIDPTCFVDDDGQAYLLWGGDAEAPKIARLKENMTELAEEPRAIVYGANNFGEGGYMHKRNGIYYFSYTCNTCYPYQGYYAMGDSPYGPFEYKGELNHAPPGAQDHHSIIEYHNQWYYFYHVGNYGADGSLYRRNICIDSLHYNEDGTMREVIQTTTGVGIDSIGMTPGVIIPGRIEAEDYFRQEGDWFDFVLQVLGDELYTAHIKVTDPVVGTKLYLFVDEILKDSVVIESDSGVITTPIFLYRGKHTLKVLYNHPDTVLGLAEVDWIDMTGETEYFHITASSTEGGAVIPAGISYYPEGDSAWFSLETYFNYILDSLTIDGIRQVISDSYALYNISENHTIQASFSLCQPIGSSATYQVNDQSVVHGTEITVTEGDNLRLMVEHDSTSVISWSGPQGLSSSEQVITLDGIGVSQKGTYTASLSNGQGCVTEHLFHVSVAYMELDVYEAERFFSQSGIRLESCNDLGGGSYVGNIENSDLCYYSFRIDEGGYYALTARVATASDGGSIEISDIDGYIATLPVDGNLSDGWEDWFTTEPVEASFKEGVQNVKFTFKGGEGTLFNFNWFDLTFIRAFDPDSTTGVGMTIQSFPNPFVTNTNIIYSLEEASTVDLQIFNSSGAIVNSLVSSERQDRGTYTITWDATDSNHARLPSGVYLIRFRSNQKTIFRKVVMISGN